MLFFKTIFKVRGIRQEPDKFRQQADKFLNFEF